MGNGIVQCASWIHEYSPSYSARVVSCHGFDDILVTYADQFWPLDDYNFWNDVHKMSATVRLVQYKWICENQKISA